MRNSIRWRIIVPYVAFLVISLGGLNLYLSSIIRDSYLNHYRSNKTSDAHILANLIVPLLLPEPSNGSLDEIVNDFSRQFDSRIIIILPTGVVVSDSFIQEGQFENHLGLQEVQEALEGQDSSNIRFSDIQQTDILSIASPIYRTDQIVGVVRMVVSLNQFQVYMTRINIYMITGSILIIIVAVGLSIFIVNFTIRPLEQLIESIKQLTSRDNYLLNPSYNLDEISQLDLAFTNMTTRLNTQIGELTTERAKLTAILNHMTDGILIIDSVGHVQLINPEAQRIFNTKESKVMGRSLIKVVRQHQIFDLWHKCHLSGNKQTTILETSPDRMFLQAIAIPLKLAIPGSILLILQDLTHLHHLEMVRQDFVSNVSHELRTPLASLKALCDTLINGAIEDPPAAHRFLKLMENEIDSLNQMVQELLELSRIESGRVPLERRIVSPYELLNPCVDRMSLQAKRAGLMLHLDCSDDLPKVFADPNRIEHVVINIIHNAIKFTPPGGSISISAYPKEQEVIFSVRDTGFGIAPEALERIFERFFKADRSRSGEGTGLGLSIARHIVNSHDGQIWAESTPGQGSTFYFSLPITKT